MLNGAVYEKISTEINHDYFPHFEAMAGMAGGAGEDYQTKLPDSVYFESQHDYLSSFTHPSGTDEQSGHRDPYSADAYQIHSLVHPDEGQDIHFYHPMSNSVYSINEAGEEYLEDTFTPSFSVDIKPKRKYLKRHQAGSLDSIDTQMSGSSNRDDTERKRRAQVKVACIHCKKACKKCDDIRPCSRCVRIGFANNCLDAPRKERKKGFKRGPYNKGRRDSMESIGDSQDWSPVDSGSETVRSYDPPKFIDHTNIDQRLAEQMVVAHENNDTNNHQEEILYIQHHHNNIQHGVEEGQHLQHEQQNDQPHEDTFYHQFPTYMDEVGRNGDIGPNDVVTGSERASNSGEHQQGGFENHYYSDLPSSGYFFPGTQHSAGKHSIEEGAKRRDSMTEVEHHHLDVHQFVSPMSIFGTSSSN